MPWLGTELVTFQCMGRSSSKPHWPLILWRPFVMLPPQACVDIPPRSPGLEAPRRLFRGRGKRREALEQRPPPGEALAAAPCEDLQAAAGPSLGWRQGQGGARLAVKEGEGTGAKVSPKPWSPAIWLKRWPPCAHVLSFPAGTGAAVRSEHWPPGAPAGSTPCALASSLENHQGARALASRHPERVPGGKAHEFRGNRR